MDAAIEDLFRSLKAEGLFLPRRDTIAAEVPDYFKKGAVATEKVNFDNDVQELLDDNAELKLRTLCNVFIGGQILDRGITVPNLIGFYDGRSPKRMQQDCVLQQPRIVRCPRWGGPRCHWLLCDSPQLLDIAFNSRV